MFVSPLVSPAHRARGYPEPVVTWRREDGNEIVLKDSSGAKQLGESCARSFLGHIAIHHPIIGSPAPSSYFVPGGGVEVDENRPWGDGRLLVYCQQLCAAVRLQEDLIVHSL